MAMEKTGYTDAIRGTTRVDVAIDNEGYIAPAGVTAVGAKKFQINSVNADNTLNDNTEVLNFFLTLANGRGDSLSNDMSVKWTV